MPCVIRRASIIKAYSTDDSYYRDKDFKTPKAKKELNSYKIGLLSFKNAYSKFKIQESGPIDSNIKEFESLYNRGMNELAFLIDKYNE